MELQDQVVSPELAKKLKKLGVKQESYAYWVDQDFGGGFPLHTRGFCTGGISAFTVAELGALMGDVDPDVMQVAYNSGFNVEGSRFVTTTGLQILLRNPDLCAAMLVYLIENNLITL